MLSYLYKDSSVFRCLITKSTPVIPVVFSIFTMTQMQSSFWEIGRKYDLWQESIAMDSGLGIQLYSKRQIIAGSFLWSADWPSFPIGIPLQVPLIVIG